MDPHQAILNGCAKAEAFFIETVERHTKSAVVDRSGSCAHVTLIVDDMAYVFNLGDTRAIMSCNGGRNYIPLSSEHTGRNKDEKQRVIDAGGTVEV